MDDKVFHIDLTGETGDGAFDDRLTVPCFHRSLCFHQSPATLKTSKETCTSGLPATHPGEDETRGRREGVLARGDRVSPSWRLRRLRFCVLYFAAIRIDSTVVQD